MPITVLTTRDGDGLPTTREVYTTGIKYAVVQSVLQVYADDSRVLAYYPSGSWSSVLVDDPVQVVPAGQPLPAPLDIPVDDVLAVPVDVGVQEAGLVGDATDEPVADTTDGDVLAADADIAPVPTDESVEIVDATEVIEASRPAPAPQRPAPTPAPATSRRRPAATTAPAGAASPAAAKPRASTVPPWMLPVAFTPKTFRAAQSDTTATRRRRGEVDDPRARMLRVSFRPKTFRAARPAPGDVPDGAATDGDSRDRDTDD